MKNVLKGMLVLLICVSLIGCGIKKSASGAVEEFLNQYRNLSSNVLEDLEEVADDENLSDKQKEQYKSIIKKQYQDLKYEITSEAYNGDTAEVEAKIKVYDLYKAQKEANEEKLENSDKFNDDNDSYSEDLFMDYKLDKMQKTMDTVEYTIKFELEKDDKGNYKVINLGHEELEKIHGIYNYDNA